MNPKIARRSVQEVLARRGRGRGVGGPRQWDGGPLNCVCPSCGQVLPHDLGIPCNSKVCPNCGVALRGAPSSLEFSQASKISKYEINEDLAEQGITDWHTPEWQQWKIIRNLPYDEPNDKAYDCWKMGDTYQQALEYTRASFPGLTKEEINEIREIYNLTPIKKSRELDNISKDSIRKEGTAEEVIDLATKIVNKIDELKQLRLDLESAIDETNGLESPTAGIFYKADTALDNAVQGYNKVVLVTKHDF